MNFSEERYKIYDNGDIVRLAYTITYSDGRVFNYKEFKLKQVVNKKTGYVHVGVRGIGSNLLHRILALRFIPNPENKPNINHKDGNKLNNNLDNLEWCTQSENVIHAYKFLGYTVSNETKSKLSKALTGKKKSAEHIEKVRLRNSGSLSAMAIKLIDLSTGIEYGCIKDYAKQNNLNYHTLKGQIRRSSNKVSNLQIIK